MPVKGAGGLAAGISGVACAGFHSPRRDDAAEDLFGAMPVVIGAAVGAAFFFVITVGEMGDVAFWRRGGGRVG